jgi:hypothetical protein
LLSRLAGSRNRIWGLAGPIAMPGSLPKSAKHHRNRQLKSACLGDDHHDLLQVLISVFNAG